MKNIMHFKNKDNRQLRCVINELPAIPRGQQRGEWTERPGLDGAQFESDDALNANDMPVNIYISPCADINQVIEWLSGAGNLRFNDWPWFWKAAIDSPLAIRPAPFNDGWNVTVTFKTQPHRYLYPEIERISVANGDFITNPCTALALPLIQITGTGDINLMVGSESMLIQNLNGSISIDCEAKIAYGGEYETFMTGKIVPAEGWPALNTGATGISWTGNITEMFITPRWRWL